MQNKKTIIYTIVGIIVLVAVFYGGMVYGKNQTSNSTASKFGTNMQNRASQFGNGGGRANGGNFITGEIISKDNTSITLKLVGGGSKIIFLDPKTEITKTASGSNNDLIIGTQISTTGTTNPDGSITTKSVQIRPQVKPNTATQ